MLRTILFISFLALELFSQDLIIKSLRAYSESEPELPVIVYSNGTNTNYLWIDFDIQSDFIPNLNIIFRFCDRNWNPTDNIFLLNNGYNTAYNLDYQRLPVTVANAKYHYRGSFPDRNGMVQFPFSGKWRFYITDSQDTSIVYGQGKFYAIYDELPLAVTLDKKLIEEKTFFPQDLARVYNISTDFNLSEDFFPNFVDHVELVENQKINYPIIIDKNFNTTYRQFYWDGNRRFSFQASDITPGNEYRQTDTRNINRFNSENVRAQFDGLENSRFYQKARRDLNGGSILTEFNNEFATYLNVKFEIRPPDEIISSIYLVGAFNNWKLLPLYEMKNDYGVYSITIPLKRGVYDYQYVTADNINGEIRNDNWLILEGNFWETVNAYHIFLYYNDPNYGGYDRIIGYKKILSR